MKFRNPLRFLSHLAGLFGVALCLLLSSTAAQSQANQPWIPTWAMAPAAQPLNSGAPASFTLSDQTLRLIVHTSVAGAAARVHLSNRFGVNPVTISDVHVALSSSQTGSVTIVAGSDHAITFGGTTSVTIPAGQEVSSDSIAFNVPALTDLAVSLYFPSGNNYTNDNLTAQTYAWQQGWYANGDVSGATTITPVDSTSQRYFLTGVDVQSPALTGTLVAFGASLTEGYEDNGASQSTNHRWPDFLAQRLNSAGINVGISNAGIAGNSLLSGSSTIFGQSGVSRFMQDAVMQPNARWVVISDDPINDLQNPSITAASLEAGLTQIIGQAHAAQIKVICSTLTPFGKSTRWNTTVEQTREAIDTWLESSSSGCDAIFDQASAIADSSNSQQIAAQYDSGDGLHPNDAGYQAIANAFNINILTTTTSLAPANPSTSCGTLSSGQTLQLNQSLLSCDGRFTLALGSSGDLTVNEGASQLYSAGTAGKNVSQGELRVNGDFVLFDNTGRPIWATNADHYPNSNLIVQNDGNVVIYNGSGAAVWNTATCCH
jgi:lysophospholipase L1-like esterase